MKREIKKTEKYITEKTFNSFEDRFEGSARATAKSFSDQAEVLAIILKEIRINNEDNEYFRSNISNLNIEGLSYDKKIENLTVRVEKLEKVKSR